MLTLRSPAKINLFLRVLSKRNDGYHEIATLIQAIGLYDTLTVSFSKKDAFSCDDDQLKRGSDNLVIKALTLFRKKTNLLKPVSIVLKKKIPIQAGLGGGSSNAATMLWALNTLFKKPLSEKELIEIGKAIGSDVPFFFSLGTALCTGRGENIQNIFGIKKQYVRLEKPPFGLSTKRVYDQVKVQARKSFDQEKVLESFKTDSPQYFNDLEKPALLLEPKLKYYKDKATLMSGSGTAFFTITTSDEKAYPFVCRTKGLWDWK